MPLPLTLDTLGSLPTGRVFDDKVSQSSEFQYDGTQGGDQWESKLECYPVVIIT